MEINEIRYFLAVAQVENMHQASDAIGVSVGSLSKAISKLENELQVKLFRRVGRNIQLTEHGYFLKQKGHELIQLENSIRTDMLGKENAFKVTIAASEVLLAAFGISISQKIVTRYEKAVIQLETVKRNDLISKVRDGDIDLGITTYDVPLGMDQKLLATINFNTFISSKHALFKKSLKGKIHVAEVLDYPFVVPSTTIWGKIDKSDSPDGWRDDKLPRWVRYRCASLKTIEELVTDGSAIVYLPNYHGAKLGFQKLDIDGCPYHCRQKVKMFTKDKNATGWLNQLF